MEPQRVDLYQPLMSNKKGAPPLVLRVGVQNADVYTQGGTATSPVRAEAYILLSALPEEIRRRVEIAVQALIAGQ